MAAWLSQRKVVGIGLLAVAGGISVLFIALGMWQLDRAGQKRTTLEEFNSRGSAEQVDLNQSVAGENSALPGYRAIATGRYIGPNILLDNQLHQGRAGYLVYTVFELDGRSQKLLVNRGWIPAETDRRRTPELNTPLTSRRLVGRLSEPPATGWRLDGSDLIEHMAATLWRVQGIDFAALTASLDEDLLSITLLLEDDAPAGFVRDWTLPVNDEARHLGYAFQWFAMAAAIAAITAVLMLRNRQAGIS